MTYTLVYSINEEKFPKALYVNLTNACTNACIFCLRNQKDDVCGAEMWHDDEYQIEDIIEQFESKINKVMPNGEFYLPEQVVFCGYGEPFLRKSMMKSFCKYLRKNYPHIKIRVNTNGHANAIYHSNVAEEFKDLLDSVSVSLNAADDEMYKKICKPRIPDAYDEVKDFIRACVAAGIETSTSIVTGFDKVHYIDEKKCEEISKQLGAKFRNREYIENGY